MQVQHILCMKTNNACARTHTSVGIAVQYGRKHMVQLQLAEFSGVGPCSLSMIRMGHSYRVVVYDSEHGAVVSVILRAHAHITLSHTDSEGFGFGSIIGYHPYRHTPIPTGHTLWFWVLVICYTLAGGEICPLNLKLPFVLRNTVKAELGLTCLPGQESLARPL